MAFDSSIKDIAMAQAAVMQTGNNNDVPTTVSTTGIEKDIIEPGNIDILNRPQYRHPDGSISTVHSMIFEEDGHQVLVPSVLDEKTMVGPEGAWKQYQKTGKHLGKFSTVGAADTYAQRLHEQQDKYYRRR